MDFVEKCDKDYDIEWKPFLYRYQAIVERKYHEDIGEYRSYGIQVILVTCDGYELVRTVSDVTVDQEIILALTDKFNRLQLSPVHLMEALDNELALAVG